MRQRGQEEFLSCGECLRMPSACHKQKSLERVYGFIPIKEWNDGHGKPAFPRQFKRFEWQADGLRIKRLRLPGSSRFLHQFVFGGQNGKIRQRRRTDQRHKLLPISATLIKNEIVYSLKRSFQEVKGLPELLQKRFAGPENAFDPKNHRQLVAGQRQPSEGRFE